MKKFVFLLVAFFSLVLLISPGCKKDQMEPVVPPSSELSLKVIATPETIESQQIATINIVVSNADSTVSNIPGANIKGSFSKPFEVSPVETTTYFVRSYLSNKMQEQIVTVTVKSSKPTLVLKVIPDTLPIYGGQVKITWNTNAKDGVFYNGVSYFDGSAGISIGVTKTSSFELIAKNGSFETAQSVNVFVLTPKPKEAKMAYGKSWRIQYSQESYDYNGVSGGTWTNTDIDFSVPCLADDIVKFSLSPQKYTYDLNTLCSGGVYATPDPFGWFLNDKDELIGLSPVRTVLDSPPHTLVWTYYNPEHRWDAVTQQFVDIPRYSKEFLEEVED